MKQLSDTLGIEHQMEIIQPKSKQEVKVVEPAIEEQPDREEDYRLARGTFRGLIDKGNDAIEGITELAKQSESPRAYEVLATLMKTVADTTKDLFELQKKNKDLVGGSSEKKIDETNITVDKAVFVGTTAELLKQIKSQQSG